ncbi:MAG TPA: response regulator [Candidatus Limnocylindrales bacterium]|nr:response regulator [Candidatus Limnocylindrales bacterium]
MKYVLIAEDDPDIADVLTEGIADRLYVATHVVANGALVPDAIYACRPDLLILDVQLPGLSGLDVFDLVRNDPRWIGIPVLFLTANPEKAQTAYAATGEHRIMAKPFDLNELVAVVDDMVDGGSSLSSPTAIASVSAAA